MRQKKSYNRTYSQQDTQYTITHDATLLEYLIETLPQKSRTTIKSYLSHRQIAVNGKTQTAFDYPLAKGDLLVVRKIGEKAQNPNHKIKFIYEDDYIIVIEKKNGLLTMSTGKENEQTAYSILMEHVRHRNPNNRVFIVHRLDRDTSGLLLFAKNEEIQEILQTNWNNDTIKRQYVAVVEGTPEKPADRIVSWLTENTKSLKMQSSPIDNGGKMAITNYTTIKSNQRYSLLQISLETGRKNQIRVQLTSIGNPIAGDKRYGARTNPLGRLCLHAQMLSFRHPITHEPMSFDTEIPRSFL